MQGRILFSVTFAATALGALGASAGGPVTTSTEAPVAVAETAPPFAWVGPYAGMALSLPTGDNFFTERSVDARATPGDWEGTLGYLSGGYDWQRNRLVYGAAMDLALGSLEAQGESSSEYGCGSDGCDIDLSKYISLRGRVGVTRGAALWYGTAGIARADAEAGFVEGEVAGSDTLTGWVAGLGVEYRVSKALSVDVSYLHSDLGRLEIGDCGVDCFTDVSFGQLKLGANFRW